MKMNGLPTAIQGIAWRVSEVCVAESTVGHLLSLSPVTNQISNAGLAGTDHIALRSH